jgi:hypothetical protein
MYLLLTILFYAFYQTPNVGVTPTPEDWHNWTNYWSFHVPWWISLACVAGFFYESWPDIKYSGLYKYVGFEEAHQLWKDSNGYFKYKLNIIATAAIGAGCFVFALVWFSPFVLLMPLVGLVRLIYGYTKLGKDIKFRLQKQKDFLNLLSKATDTSDSDLAVWFTAHSGALSFDWGTAGDQIVQKGGQWVYRLFPTVISKATDEAAAYTELRRKLYNLSVNQTDATWLIK